MTSTDAAYLAALIDGEGNIVIARICKKGYSPSYSVRVVVSNTNRRLMEWCEKRGATTKPTKRKTGSWPMRRPGYVAVWTTRKAVEILRHVLPYLVIKVEQAETALALDAVNREKKWRRVRLTSDEIERREALKRRLNELNRTKP